MDITYIRDGQKYTTTLMPEHVKQEKYQIGVSLEQNGTISAVSDKTPAAVAGIVSGDRISAVNGVKVENSTQISEQINKCNGQSIDITVSRNGSDVHYP